MTATTKTAGALKRGRNPQWPFVPVVTHTPTDGSRGFTQQIRGKAFATRAEAVEYAQRYIDVNDAHLAQREAEYEARHR